MFDMKKYQREYRLQHKEKMRRYKREYYLQHKEEMRKHNQEYWEKHGKMIKNKLREEKHRKGINKRYYSKLGIYSTPEYQSAQRANRRARFRNAGKLTFQVIQEVYDENIISNGGVLRCIYCGKELTKKEATLEHKQPLSRGGTNDKENLAIACLYCNLSKNNKTEAEFREWLKNKEGRKKCKTQACMF